MFRKTKKKDLEKVELIIHNFWTLCRKYQKSVVVTVIYSHLLTLSMIKWLYFSPQGC